MALHIHICTYLPCVLLIIGIEILFDYLITKSIVKGTNRQYICQTKLCILSILFPNREKLNFAQSKSESGIYLFIAQTNAKHINGCKLKFTTSLKSPEWIDWLIHWLLSSSESRLNFLTLVIFCPTVIPMRFA